jgi:hypothetical protein
MQIALELLQNAPANGGKSVALLPLLDGTQLAKMPTRARLPLLLN